MESLKKLLVIIVPISMIALRAMSKNLFASKHSKSRNLMAAAASRSNLFKLGTHILTPVGITKWGCSPARKKKVWVAGQLLEN